MLTKDELRLIRKDIEAYPQGVPSNAWGFGPMGDLVSDDDDEDGDYPSAIQPREVLEEFG